MGDRLDRSDRWAGLRPGDPVAVPGSGGRAVWTFVAHVRNTRTGEEWVEVVGGKPGHRAVRSFHPERVHPAGTGSRRRPSPSLADAPQLPFG